MRTANLVFLRDNRIHSSTMMLLSIINDLASRTETAFIGEIQAHYESYQRRVFVDKAKIRPVGYTYGGMAAHLTTMTKRGLLIKHREGRCVHFSVSLKGRQVLDQIR